METMIVYLIWFIASVVIAHYATKRGQNGVIFLFVSLILSPLIGIVLLLVSDDKSAELSIKNKITKKCKHCAEIIKYEAVKCRFCGETQE